MRTMNVSRVILIIVQNVKILMWLILLIRKSAQNVKILLALRMVNVIVIPLT